MKKTILLALLALLMTTLQAQDKKETAKPENKVVVPELVKKSFAKEFPAAVKVEWGIEKPGEYEAEFTKDKSEMSALFDEAGALLEVETEIEKSELPSAISASLAKDFVGYKIDEIEKNDSKGIITYEMEVKKDKEKFELVFDASGKLLKKIAEKGEKDSD
jgi:hypothetical protein